MLILKVRFRRTNLTRRLNAAQERREQPESRASGSTAVLDIPAVWDAETVDEQTIVFEAERVQWGTWMDPVENQDADGRDLPPSMHAWSPDQVEDLRNVTHYDHEGQIGGIRKEACRLIELVMTGKPLRWILASEAWLMGPDGRNIEHITA